MSHLINPFSPEPADLHFSSSFAPFENTQTLLKERYRGAGLHGIEEEKHPARYAAGEIAMRASGFSDDWTAFCYQLKMWMDLKAPIRKSFLEHLSVSRGELDAAFKSDRLLAEKATADASLQNRFVLRVFPAILVAVPYPYPPGDESEAISVARLAVGGRPGCWAWITFDPTLIQVRVNPSGLNVRSVWQATLTESKRCFRHHFVVEEQEC